MVHTNLQASLTQKLLHFLGDNNPDLVIQLEDEGQISTYLASKLESVRSLWDDSVQPNYALEQTCMEVMTADLLPSKYNFVCTVLEEEFESRYWQLKGDGLLKFEALNVLSNCQPVFEAMHFGEATEGNRLLHYAVAGIIANYFEESQREAEIVSHGVQQPA